LDADGGRVDRAIDMALCGEMIHGARAVLLEDRRHRRTIADVGADEDVIGTGENGRQIVEITRVGQLIDGDDALSIGDKRANQR
jgi:hypothetical protein